jgi:hypothetical protein
MILQLRQIFFTDANTFISLSWPPPPAAPAWRLPGNSVAADS